MIAYIADISALTDVELFKQKYAIVSDVRKAKIDRMRLDKDKRLSLGAELLLMQACKDFGIDYPKQKFVYDEFGKPKFADCEYHFSLSHSGSRAMCVMTENSVGCDVEQITCPNLEIAKRFFSEDEYARIDKCETQTEKDDLFFRLWTLKESFMKCTGQGFHIPMNRFSISIHNHSIELKQSLNDSTYSFYEFDAKDGYKYATCIKNSGSAKVDIQWKFIDISK